MDKSKPPKSKALKFKERCAPAVKRSSSNSSSNSNTEIVDAAEDLDLTGATSKLRHQIVNWQRTQNNIQLRQLKEHKDYEVVIESSSKQGVSCSAVMMCKMCDTRIHLNVDQSNIFKLSNWIRHVKLCVQGKRTKSKQNNQIALTNYFSPSSSSSKSTPRSTPDLETSTSGLETPSSDIQPPISSMQQLATSRLQPSMPDLQPQPTSGLQLTPAASTTAQASGQTEAYVPMANISMQNHSNVANQLNDCRQGFQLAPPIVKK